MKTLTPKAASEFAKAPRPEAIAEAETVGYIKTKPFAKAQQKSSKQYGLPRSGKGLKSVPMKG